MRADILAINGDPLADIRVLQDSGNIHLIMKDGHAFKPLH
jgi:imidazolonepropionase-like amidohydrolase